MRHRQRYPPRGALIAFTALATLILAACGDVNPTEQSLARTATAFFAATRAPSAAAAGSVNRPTVASPRAPASVIAPATPTPIPAFVGSAVSAASPRVGSVAALSTATRVPAPTPVQVVTITADGNVNLRSAPAANASVVTQLRPGTEVSVVQASVAAQDGGTAWVKVNANGQMGYVRSDFVSTPHAPTASAATPTTTTVTGATTATPTATASA